MGNAEDMPDTMALDELADRLRITLNQAFILAKANQLPIPVIRIGRQLRFSRQAYECLMNGQHPPEKLSFAQDERKRGGNKLCIPGRT